jgi:hypothetical protein
VPALALDPHVVRDGAGADLARHLAVGVRGVAALDPEPGVVHLVRRSRRVDAVLVVAALLAVLHVANRDGLLVEALLRAGLPVDPPADAEDKRDQHSDRAFDTLLVTVSHGGIPSLRPHVAAISNVCSWNILPYRYGYVNNRRRSLRAI